MKRPSVYELREAGRSYCQTEGSDHYKEGEIEPFDLMVSKDIAEGFCIGNIIKYSTRFTKTRNLEDLKKVSDYSHLLCGIVLDKRKPKPREGNENGKGTIQSSVQGEDKSPKDGDHQ